ncbi:MotA/TolQ/ExbB proton channel family protein [Luteolibacter pohnpeiensis]|uniref:MotA/TolQ/ExbB proton channel family protein n=1 Tax=Luteolibacter pohnpeiensis TaxID=454153 RepID=A0A934SA58_9BACT|nr:MotA/TolQ/ExbB proton channel family protein [Luteolibacter pohnpeiensis]MBK1884205.1 MotA/TolQ/ExbB proton channel family protein [Luteolibacter pohnpeiensis]
MDFTRIFQDGWQLFLSGGAIMYMLGAVACLLYATAFAALAYVNKGNLNEKDVEQWAAWIEQPDQAKGRLGEALRYVLHGPRLTLKTVARRFDEIRLTVLSAIDRRLLVLNTLIAAAPLAGLLGTVMGMLAMFAGLSQGKGPAGMQRVADGMQQALITTQTGLTIALPGLFIALIIRAKRNRIDAALVRLESLILTTRFHRDH